MKDFETLDEAFPQCVHGITPLGARVLLQLKSVKKASKGGIILVEETRETERAQSMIGKVLALGPIAFKNRDTLSEWGPVGQAIGSQYPTQMTQKTKFHCKS